MRNSYWYNSPRVAPNQNFNFWQDIKSNLLIRNKWEDKNILGGEVSKNSDNMIFPRKSSIAAES